MLLSFLSSGDFRSAVISILLTLPIVLIALSFHEASHAYAAYKLGDRTAYNLGRMTFNPIKHLDPLGFLFMLVFGYGWAKPVPINARNFKNPKKGMALSAIAGPIMNFLLGTLGALLYCLAVFIANKNIAAIIQSEFTINLVNILFQFFFMFSIMNFMLATYNMIPLPPFDGSRFFSLFLPQKWYFGIMRYERYIMYGILILSFICARLFSFSPLFWVAEKLFNLVCIPMELLFSLF
jgi:Zn-dependent protease